MISDYRDLKVWQNAMTLCEKVYAHLRKFPAEERYGLCDQLRRAVVSVPSNIAEGNGRDSRSEYAHFLSIARGSICEVQTQLELGERLGYAEVADDIKILVDNLSRMLLVMIRKLRTP